MQRVEEAEARVKGMRDVRVAERVEEAEACRLRETLAAEMITKARPIKYLSIDNIM